MRESLARVIRTGGWESECFDSAEDFMIRQPRTCPCCLVLDVTLPGVSGLELQTRLAGRGDMPVIFVTDHNDAQMIVQAMKAGAVEFLTKPVNGAALLHAIGTAIERSRAALRRDSEMWMLGTCYGMLTPRERDVMALVVSGRLNKQVAFELGISEATVKAHRGQVMRKMQAGSLPELVTMAIRLGLMAGATH
jgi:FixJ family two-component response regulator